MFELYFSFHFVIFYHYWLGKKETQMPLFNSPGRGPSQTAVS